MVEPSKRAEILIDLLYLIAIGINAYVIVDSMTNGELTRAVGREWRHLRDEWKAKVETERQIRRDTFEVIMQASEMLEGETET